MSSPTPSDKGQPQQTPKSRDERNKEILDSTSPEQKVLLDAIVKAMLADQKKTAPASPASAATNTKSTPSQTQSTQQKKLVNDSATSPSPTEPIVVEKTEAQLKSEAEQTDQYAQLMSYLLSTLNKLDLQEYVNEKLSRRFSVVNGKILLTYLVSTDYNKLAAKLSTTDYPNIKSFADFSVKDFQSAINIMIERGYLKRVVPLAVNKKRYQTTHNVRIDFAETDAQFFDHDGLYALMLQPQSSSWALIKSLLVVLGIFLIACYKIWPIFLRIVLWWFLLFTTIFLVSSIIIHLLSKIIFTLLCLRGFSFMPNLLDDEVGFFQTFSPLFGTGGEHQKRWQLERHYQIKAREKLNNPATSAIKSPNDSDSTPQTLASMDDTLANLSELPEENIFHSWQAGVFAFIILFLIGALGAYNMGLFDPELVPNFVVNNAEMRQYFPQIAATTASDDYIHEEVSME